jgi:drug/metabolite transporter (DMT)-like permease
LSASSIHPPEPAVEPKTLKQSFLLVFSCTVIGAAAQMLIKTGAGQLGVHLSFLQILHEPMLIVRFAFSILQNIKLFIGYSLYGINAVLMAYALRGQELSRLFPIIALTYVWVTILSAAFLHEHVNVVRILGVALIVGGVSILGQKAVGGKA